MVVKCGVYFAEVDRTIGDLRSVAVGCTDHLTCPESTTCDQSIANVRPVIAARFRIDSWRASEFPPRHDGDIFIKTPFVKIGDQRVHPLIE